MSSISRATGTISGTNALVALIYVRRYHYDELEDNHWLKSMPFVTPKFHEQRKLYVMHVEEARVHMVTEAITSASSDPKLEKVACALQQVNHGVNQVRQPVYVYLCSYNGQL